MICFPESNLESIKVEGRAGAGENNSTCAEKIQLMWKRRRGQSGEWRSRRNKIGKNGIISVNNRVCCFPPLSERFPQNPWHLCVSLKVITFCTSFLKVCVCLTVYWQGCFELKTICTIFSLYWINWNTFSGGLFQGKDMCFWDWSSHLLLT